MPMEPIPGPGLDPQPPFGFSPHHHDDGDYSDLEYDGPPKVGYYEPGIPTGDDPHSMYRFRDDNDCRASEFSSSQSDRSYSSNSSTGFLFPLLLLLGAFWFVLNSQPAVTDNGPQFYQEEQVQ